MLFVSERFRSWSRGTAHHRFPIDVLLDVEESGTGGPRFYEDDCAVPEGLSDRPTTPSTLRIRSHQRSRNTPSLAVQDVADVRLSGSVLVREFALRQAGLRAIAVLLAFVFGPYRFACLTRNGAEAVTFSIVVGAVTLFVSVVFCSRLPRQMTRVVTRSVVARPVGRFQLVAWNPLTFDRAEFPVWPRRRHFQRDNMRATAFAVDPHLAVTVVVLAALPVEAVVARVGLNRRNKKLVVSHDATFDCACSA